MRTRFRRRQPAAGVAWPNLRTLDLSGYRVTDRDAGLFDGPRRVELLRTTADPTLRQATKAAEAGPPEPAWDSTALNPVGMIPRFYQDRAAWWAATRDLHAVEETVGRLAAAFVATGDPDKAERLLAVLVALANQEALTRFYYTEAEPQTWFAIEGTLLALGLSHSIIRPFVRGRTELPVIEAWLTRAAHEHLAVRRTSSWNNHYYRRALHAAAIGIVAGEDDLFRYGLSAVHHALAELEPSGVLPREIQRGARAVHYQNYALLYLIPLMQLAERQGYSLWDFAPAGQTIDAAVEVTLDLLADPRLVRHYTRRRQDLSFTAQGQYFAWTEIVQARSPNARLEALISSYRPVWSRSSIGAATLYFYEPAAEG